MLFGRVLGNAVCTIKYPDLDGVKLLTVQPLNKRLDPVGRVQVAADVVHAGPGDLVLLVRSREASLAMHGVKFVPIDLACVGVVDELEVRPAEGGAEFKPGWTRYT
jgi:ethanolamine utilization protein EutN